MTAATEARDAGMAQAEDAADMRVVALIDTLIAVATERGIPFSANTIRDCLPTTSSQGLVGARVRAAAMRGEIVKVGEEPSTLRSTHGKPIAVWRKAVSS